MGERKVLNKYYPPDFDPSKIPRRRQPKNQQIKVRMMLPMSIRCATCGNYIYKGTKFNSRKEDVIGETYLGIQIFRFYFKCTKCSAEITIKTDPQNSDYTVETGATRNFEPWRATDEALEDAQKKKDAEEMGDAMKSLENRTIDSKREMDILAALDEMKSMRARHASVDTEDMLKALRNTAELKEKELAEEDEAVIRSVVFQSSANYFRRLDDDDFEDEDEDDHLDTVKATAKRPKSDIHERVIKGADSQSEHLFNRDSEEQHGRTISTGLKTAFTFGPKNVAFNIRPKKQNPVSSAEEAESLEEKSLPATLNSDYLNENQLTKVDLGVTSLSSLCATYDSDSSG
eukprot:c22361_g1_i1 orf=562-1596(-)